MISGSDLTGSASVFTLLLLLIIKQKRAVDVPCNHWLSRRSWSALSSGLEILNFLSQYLSVEDLYSIWPWWKVNTPLREKQCRDFSLMLSPRLKQTEVLSLVSLFIKQIGLVHQPWVKVVWVNYDLTLLGRNIKPKRAIRRLFKYLPNIKFGSACSINRIRKDHWQSILPDSSALTREYS